ncbi:GNAT family N-acetyltransferase [Paenibacillus polymyxa]|uniref:GNAT family N-acetyltransferase n=1 Tax=Paenibacillus polymyxa TaxID=1406 RepID=UPI00234BD7C5|nr:GNAT family N-acetyltransferase [Paenibacillus polymyxa]WCM60723.1 GNAT family N-acetyltransferase [Paenibacillus polymyxa]
MSLNVKPITKDLKEINNVYELFRNSFPVNEQIPMWFLWWKSKKDFIDFIAFYDEDVFVGFTYLITNKNLTFVLYLAIDSEIRSKGYGGRLLSNIKKQYPHNRIILNIEAVEEAAINYEQRLKRKNFYMRNGYSKTSFNLFEYGQSYEVLVNGSEVSTEEYRDLFKRFTGPVLSLFFKPKFYFT